MAEETVEVIGAEDRQSAVAALMLAFSSDPVVRWAWPEQSCYLTYWPQFVEAFGGGAFDHGTAHGLEHRKAVALWLSPGVEPDGESVMRVVRESLDDATFEDIGGVF